MKIFYLALFLLSLQGISAQIVNIPDVNFKNKVLASNSSNTIAKNLAGMYFAVDANGDGVIQQSEALQVKSLDVKSSNIASLDGILDFENLEILDCSQNSIDKLYLSNLISLKWLNASNNVLTNGGVSIGANIEHIDLHNVTFSPNELDFSNKPMLSYLNLQNSNVYTLDCSNSKLITLMLNGCNNLNELDCSYNLLTSLDLSGLNIIGNAYYLGSGPNASIYYQGGINCSHNNLTNLNVNSLTTNFLDCSYNSLITLDASSLTFVKIPNVPISEIPVPSLYFDCSHNQLTTLTVNDNLSLQYFSCSYNNLNSLHIPKIITPSFNCSHNNITSLNITDISEINRLDLSYNSLTSFVSPILQYISDTSLLLFSYPDWAIQNINCSNNLLTFLDLNNTQINSIDASNNTINTLFIKNGILNDNLNLQNNPSIQFICTDNIPLSPPDSYSELNYYQDMLPTSTISNTCSTLSIKENESSNEPVFSIYPNPATDYIKITPEEEIINVAVFDSTGREINVNTKNNQIDIRKLNEGVYLMNIETKRRKVFKKVIINKH